MSDTYVLLGGRQSCRTLQLHCFYSQKKWWKLPKSEVLFTFRIRLVAKAANLHFLWSGVTEKPQPKAARHFFAAFIPKKPQVFFDFAAFDRTTPKMNNGHAGSAVAAVLATLRSPLQEKKLRYYLTSGWARDNYSISLKWVRLCCRRPPYHHDYKSQTKHILRCESADMRATIIVVMQSSWLLSSSFCPLEKL